ncbi:class I SAM-dependent methyltransferase [Roseibium sp. MMSF_3544]|uniref:class I SAM-dependent methyltransferase n=1 Tax=unclassified Roseibium TaxID=2629323 RepID=UPI00273FC768|nr:methyltransferase domain-containing protein [Roseibium sp. MMSF_3544]
MNALDQSSFSGPDLKEIKQRQQTVWSTGDYPAVGTTLQIVGETLAEALDLAPGERVLDVAAGNGNATLAAARRFCDVVSTDYVEAWLKNGMERAKAERLPVAFREADAENLPFDDTSFDVVTSTFGVMFTADQDAAARSMLRVCKPGGRIGMANWTAAGFIGQVFKTIGRHMPPPAGVRSPLEWASEARLQDLFGNEATSIAITSRTFVFRYRSARDWVESWREIYGPMNKAFQAVGAEGAAALEADLVGLAEAASVGGERAMIVPAEYAEIVIHKR